MYGGKGEYMYQMCVVILCSGRYMVTEVVTMMEGTVFKGSTVDPDFIALEKCIFIAVLLAM